MKDSKKIILAGIGSLAVIAILFGVLAVQSKILVVNEPQQIVVVEPDPVAPVDDGDVLGESSDVNKSNPLNNVYVNPFKN